MILHDSKIIYPDFCLQAASSSILAWRSAGPWAKVRPNVRGHGCRGDKGCTALGKPWENHRKMVVWWWFHVSFMDEQNESPRFHQRCRKPAMSPFWSQRLWIVDPNYHVFIKCGKLGNPKEIRVLNRKSTDLNSVFSSTPCLIAGG